MPKNVISYDNFKVKGVMTSAKIAILDILVEELEDWQTKDEETNRQRWLLRTMLGYTQSTENHDELNFKISL